MAKLDLPMLRQALVELAEYKMPSSQNGAMRYLYELYAKILNGCDITLRGIDFERFELDEIVDFSHYYEDIIRHNCSVTCRLKEYLRKTRPSVSKASFI